MSIFVGKTFSNLYEIYLKDNTAENNYKKFCELVTINFLKKIGKFNPIFAVDADSLADIYSLMDTNSLVVDAGLLE